MDATLPANVLRDVEAELRAGPYRHVFATISGAHLYGFPSHDSDVDLRGIHVQPVEEVLGLQSGSETVEANNWRNGILIETVTHDIRKFIRLLLKHNGYVLEQLYSPLVILSTPEHDELKELALACICRQHALHYLGFAASEWKLIRNKRPRTIKRVLYIYRVLLTGIHLMQTGEVEANLVRLNAARREPLIDELIRRKIEGIEQEQLVEGTLDVYERDYSRLADELKAAAETSSLPETPGPAEPLNDFLVRTRIKTIQP